MPYFCYTCNNPRSKCPPGLDKGGCAITEADAAEYRAEKAAGAYKPMFSTHRLRAENAGGYTQREIAKDIFDEARRAGREIERAR